MPEAITLKSEIVTKTMVIDYTDLLSYVDTAAAVFTMMTLNPRSKVIAASSHVITAFAGATTMVGEIGDGSDPNEYLGQDDMKATAGTTVEGTAMYDSIDHDGASPVKITMTAGTEYLDDLTAGRVEFQVTYLNTLIPA